MSSFILCNVSLCVFVFICMLTATTACSNSAGSNEVLEGQVVEMACDITYYGYKRPVMEWYSPSGSMQSELHIDEENPERIT